PGELEPEQRVVELRGGSPEGGRDLLHDLLLQRGVRLLDVEPLAEPVEIRALVADVLQLRDERLPRRLAPRVSTSTSPATSRGATALLVSFPLRLSSVCRKG